MIFYGGQNIFFSLSATFSPVKKSSDENIKWKKYFNHSPEKSALKTVFQNSVTKNVFSFIFRNAPR
jgi:hypothetical protein